MVRETTTGGGSGELEGEANATPHDCFHKERRMIRAKRAVGDRFDRDSVRVSGSNAKPYFR